MLNARKLDQGCSIETTETLRLPTALFRLGIVCQLAFKVLPASINAKQFLINNTPMCSLFVSTRPFAYPVCGLFNT